MADMMPKEKVAPMVAVVEKKLSDTPVIEAPVVQSIEQQPGPEKATESPADDTPADPTGDFHQDLEIKTVVLEEVQPELPAGQTETVPVRKLTFTVGKQVFETNGITRATLMELFKICPRVGKKYGADKPREMLIKEFGVEHRTDLTEEQAERYTIRLREMLEG